NDEIQEYATIVSNYLAGKLSPHTFNSYITNLSQKYLPESTQHSSTTFSKKIPLFTRYIDIDTSDLTLPKKIKNASLSKYNYAVVIGERELKNPGVVVLRDLRGGDLDTKVKASREISVEDLNLFFEELTENFE
ncbi:hypothetical protein HK098_006259, partial [Nowakowskiella sp. JEL0407]